MIGDGCFGARHLCCSKQPGTSTIRHSSSKSERKGFILSDLPSFSFRFMSASLASLQFLVFFLHAISFTHHDGDGGLALSCLSLEERKAFRAMILTSYEQPCTGKKAHQRECLSVGHAVISGSDLRGLHTPFHQFIPCSLSPRMKVQAKVEKMFSKDGRDNHTMSDDC